MAFPAPKCKPCSEAEPIVGSWKALDSNARWKFTRDLRIEGMWLAGSGNCEPTYRIEDNTLIIAFDSKRKWNVTIVQLGSELLVLKFTNGKKIVFVRKSDR